MMSVGIKMPCSIYIFRACAAARPVMANIKSKCVCSASLRKRENWVWSVTPLNWVILTVRAVVAFSCWIVKLIIFSMVPLERGASIAIWSSGRLSWWVNFCVISDHSPMSDPLG